MTLLQRDIFNSPYSGVFCATNDSLTFIPPGIPNDDMEAISEALGSRFEVVTIGGSSVLGTLITMNNKGILVSNLITGMESDKIEAIATDLGLNFGVLSERSNAIGNNFLINDVGGFCNERLTPRSKTSAEEVLGIKIQSRSLNGMDTLGMIGCVTNKGGLCHPEISGEEKEVMEKVLETDPFVEEAHRSKKPLYAALVPDEIFKGSHFERRFVTPFGGVWEKLAEVVALEFHGICTRGHSISGNVGEESLRRIRFCVKMILTYFIYARSRVWKCPKRSNIFFSLRRNFNIHDIVLIE